MTLSRPIAVSDLQEIIECAADATIVAAQGGCIVAANSLAEKLFGYAPATLVGQSSALLIPSRFREQHAVHQAHFFAHPASRPMGAGRELLGFRHNGEEFPVEVSLSPLHTAAGLLAVSAIRDISERKRTEQELLSSNRHLQSALELVKQLTGFLPICSYCKKIRAANGTWTEIEAYIRDHSAATFTHGVCPQCLSIHFGTLLAAKRANPSDGS